MNKNINDNEIEKIIAGAKPQILNDKMNEARREKLQGILRLRVLSELGRAGMVKEKLTVNEIVMKNVRYWTAGAAVLAVVAIAVFVAMPKQNGGGSIALLGSNAKVTRVGDKAFGNLSSLNAETSGSTSGVPADAAGTNVSAPKAASALSAPAGSGTMGSGGSASGGTTSAVAPMPQSLIMRYPVQTVKYVYKGDTFTQDQAKMDVLKYIVTPISASQATAALAQSNLGINLSSFGNLSLQSITLSQDQDFGYTVNMDLVNGTLNIYQNYQQWPQDNNPQPLTEKNIPSDDAIIKIANQFLSDHSFAMGNYGAPEASQNNYGYAVPMDAQTDVAPSVPPSAAGGSANSAFLRPYFPDTVTILYPLIINGKSVYDSSGNKPGLTVQVNVRYNRVSNVSGVSLQNYQASSYDAITDTNKILSLAENPPFYPIIYGGPVPMMEGGVSASGAGSAGVAGGSSGSVNGSAPANSGTTIKNEIDFGTPTLGYVTMYQYDNGQSDQFLVPAYIFPILNPSQNYYYGGNKNIVVPLIADFIQDQNVGKPIPIDAPVPVSTPGAGPVTAPNK